MYGDASHHLCASQAACCCRYDDKALPYIVPNNNVRIENPVAIIDKNVDEREPEVRHAAEAFLQFLFTPEAQREFAACGFRPVERTIRSENILNLPDVKRQWTVDKKLGGWNEAQAKFFDDRVSNRKLCAMLVLCVCCNSHKAVLQVLFCNQVTNVLLLPQKCSLMQWPLQGILDKIQTEVGQKRLQERIAEKKRRSGR